MVIAAWPTLRRVGSSRFGIIGEVRLYSNGTGVWRSLVARFVRDEEAVGSNPATPTVSRRDRLVPATFVIPGRGASRRAGALLGGPGRLSAGRGASRRAGAPLGGPGRFSAGRGASRRAGCRWRGRGGAAGARRAGLATTETTARGPLHPLRAAAPVMWRCTRYVALHPNRRGVMPTDRVQRTQSQEQTRNLRDAHRHAEGELKDKTCWFCGDFSAC